jgi:CyaY protein
VDEKEFNGLADAMLVRIEAKIEALMQADEAGLDYEIKPGGVIEIEFDNESKIIVNRHTAAREIWVAARSGGYHFRPENGGWIAGRDGSELLAVLSRCISEQSGQTISLT